MGTTGRTPATVGLMQPTLADGRGSDVDEAGGGEDDFGVPLGGPIQKTPSRNRSRNKSAKESQDLEGSWEID